MQKKRIERLLLAVIGSYMQHYIDLPGLPFITVTDLEVTPDLGLAKVYISFLGEESRAKKESLMRKLLAEHHWKIKREVAIRLKHRLRKVPAELRFYLDEQPARAARISHLLAEQ